MRGATVGPIKEGDPRDLEPKVNTGLYLPQSLAEWLNGRAKELYLRSRSALIDRVLRDYMDETIAKEQAEKKTRR